MTTAPDTTLPEPVARALNDVAAERQRQIDAEGWTPEHDDEHDNGEMARAAACYALAGISNATPGPYDIENLIWPWSLDWWKPKDTRRNLVRAGAMIVAEIERLDRAESASRLRMTQPDPTTTPEGRYSLIMGHPIPLHQADTVGVDEPPRGHPEDRWTEEQHKAAESYLTGGTSLANRIALLGQGACNCNTKSPDVHMHLPTCRYRQAMELADEVDALEEMQAEVSP